MMMVRAAAETTAAAVTHEKSAEERWVALNKKYVEFLIDCALQSMTADDADRSDGEEEPCLLDHPHPHQEKQAQQGLGDEGDTDNYCDDSRPTVPIDSNARIDVATAGGGGENGATGTVVAMLLGPGSTTDDDGRRSPFAAQQQQTIHQTADKQQLQRETKVHCACGRHGEMTTAVTASTTNRDTAAASGSSSSFSAAAACSYAGLDLEAGRCSQTCSRRQSTPDSNASDLGLPYNKCCESSSFTRRCSSLEHRNYDNKTAIDATATVAARQRPDTCRQTYRGCRHLLCKKLRTSCRYRLFVIKSERNWDNKRSTCTSSEGADMLSCSARKRRNLFAAKLRQQRDQWLGLLRQQRSKQPRSRISGDSSASRLKTFATLKERRLARRTSSSSSSSSSGGSRRQVTRSAHQEQSLLDLDNSAGLQRLTLSDNRTSLHHCRSIATLSTPALLDGMKEHRQKRVSGDRRSLSRSRLSKERSCKWAHSNSNYPAVLSRNQWPFDLSESPFTPRPPTSTESGRAALSTSSPSTNLEIFSGQSRQVTSSASIFPAAVVNPTCESAITDKSPHFNQNNNVIDSTDSDRQDNVLNLTCRHIDNRSRVNSDTDIKPTLRADQGQCSAAISSKSSSIRFSGSTGGNSNPSRWLQDAAGVRGNGSGNINQSSVLNIDPNANNICRWMALNKSTLRLIVNDLVTSVFGVHADVTSSPPSTLPDDTTSNHGDCFLDDVVLHPHQVDDVTLEEAARCRSAGMALTSSSLSSDAKVRTRAMLSSVIAAGSNNNKRHHHFHHPHNACASSRAATLKWKSTMMRRMLLEDGQMQPQLHQRHQQQQ